MSRLAPAPLRHSACGHWLSTYSSWPSPPASTSATAPSCSWPASAVSASVSCPGCGVVTWTSRSKLYRCRFRPSSSRTGLVSPLPPRAMPVGGSSTYRDTSPRPSSFTLQRYTDPSPDALVSPDPTPTDSEAPRSTRSGTKPASRPAWARFTCAMRPGRWPRRPVRPPASSWPARHSTPAAAHRYQHAATRRDTVIALALNEIVTQLQLVTAATANPAPAGHMRDRGQFRPPTPRGIAPELPFTRAFPRASDGNRTRVLSLGS
jgi:hypothetical protein